MPNWCENTLMITGPSEVLDKIVINHTNDGQKFDFNTILPYPDECREADAKISAEKGVRDAFSEIGYRWCVTNWGTKWNSHGTEMNRWTDKIVLDFETAWGPPLPIISKLGEMYPEVSILFTYEEPGMAFMGSLTIENGTVKDFWERDMIPDDEDDEILNASELE